MVRIEWAGLEISEVALPWFCIVKFSSLSVRFNMTAVIVSSGFRKAVVSNSSRVDAAMIYVHPWEIDPDQPRLPLSLLAGMTVVEEITQQRVGDMESNFLSVT